jgi:hypothetical protein
LEGGGGVEGSGACRPYGNTAGVENGSKVGGRRGGGVERYEAKGESVVWRGPGLGCVGGVKG